MLRTIDQGLQPYQVTWDYQKKLVELRAQGLMSDTLLLVEHSEVYTIGRRFKGRVDPFEQIPVYHVERGGDITYHGPGQVVGYPILFLPESCRNLHLYLRCLEMSLIQTLADFDIDAQRYDGLTGVWVGEKKVASIGIAVKKWVTYHGFALNVNNKLEPFQAIKPCGLEGTQMTSIQALTGCTLNIETIKQHLLQHVIAGLDSILERVCRD